MDDDRIQAIPGSPGRAVPWLLLAIGLMVLGGLTAYDMRAEYRRIEEQETQRLINQANLVQEIISKRLQNTAEALDGVRDDLGSLLSQSRSPATLNHHLMSLAGALFGVRTLLVVDVNGTVIGSSRDEMMGLNFRDSPHDATLRASTDPGMLYVNPPFLTPLRNWALSVAKMVPDADGRFNGYVLAILDQDYFDLVSRTMLYAPDVRTAVVHGDGLVVQRVPDDQGLVGSNLATVSGSLYAQFRALGRAQALLDGVSSISREHLLAAFQTVWPQANPADKPLVFSISRNKDAVFSRWREDLRMKLAALVGLAVFSMATLALLQRRRLALEKVTAERAAERAKADEALRERDHFAAATVDAIPAHLCVLDCSGTIILVNAAWRRFYEAKCPAGACPPRHGLGRNYLSEIQPLCDRPDVSERVSAGVRALLEGRTEDLTVEYSCQSPTGKRWFILIGRTFAGQDGQVVLVHEDISALKQAELQLRDSEERLRLALDGSHMGTYHWDLGSGQVVWSDTYRQLFGLGADVQADYAAWLAALHPDDRELAERAVKTAMDEQADFDVDYRIVRPDGALRWIAAKGRFFYDAGGRPLRMEGLVEDITARKANEQALREAKAAAEAANVAKSAFLSAMSHELRTPLNAITGFISLVQQSALDERQAQFLAKAQVASGQLLDLINDLLSHARLDTGALQVHQELFSLDMALDQALSWMREPAAIKRLEVKVDVAEEVPRQLRGDVAQIGQVLRKLCDNAVKFTEAGQVRITVSVKSRETDRVQLRFEVADTGIGMSPEQQAGLFQAFQQGDGRLSRRYGGAGLSLATAKRLVELMGGEIGADSAPGQGSRFWFTLPLGVASAPDRETLVEASAIVDAAADAAVDVAAEYDGAAWQVLRPLLIRQLKACDLDAQALWVKHSALLRSVLGPEFEAASRAVEDFDFERALRLLERRSASH